MKSKINPLPCDKEWDSTFSFLMEGYLFIPKRCRKYHSDIFLTRLMGQNVICLSGEEAGQLFYDNEWFKRQGAAPKRIQKSLFGVGGVQALDGAEHRHRKLMFMSIMTPHNLERLTNITAAHLQIARSKWNQKQSQNKLVLYDESQKILCKIACQWSGVPLQDKEVCLRSMDLGNMVDAFGGVGCRYWQGKCARRRTEMWIKDIIIRVRTHKMFPADYTALYTIAWHRDKEGKLLSPQIAAVELINIIRPIVAIATYITFGALALHEHPECRRKIQSGDEEYKNMFVQEVRRFYPFAPCTAAKVRKNLIWDRGNNSYYLKKGTRALFDIYGTNHDPRLWKKPYDFRPERFRDFKGDPFRFVPQGGGDCYSGHRCAGEGVTMEIMKVSLSFLGNYLDYRVPKQNLRYCLRRMPTLPKSRFVIDKVRIIN